MIQLVAVAAVGAVGFYAYSSYKKHMEELKRKELVEEGKGEKVVGDLEADPKTGKYKVKK